MNSAPWKWGYIYGEKVGLEWASGLFLSMKCVSWRWGYDLLGKGQSCMNLWSFPINELCTLEMRLWFMGKRSALNEPLIFSYQWTVHPGDEAMVYGEKVSLEWGSDLFLSLPIFMITSTCYDQKQHNCVPSISTCFDRIVNDMHAHTCKPLKSFLKYKWSKYWVYQE